MPEISQQVYPELVKEMVENKETHHYHSLQTFDLSEGKLPIYPPVTNLHNSLVMLDWVTDPKEHKSTMYLQKRGIGAHPDTLFTDINFGSSFVRRPLVYIRSVNQEEINANPIIPDKTSWDLAQMSIEEAKELYFEYEKQFPEFPDYWDMIWKILLIANFAYYFSTRDKDGLFKRHYFLEDGAVLGMVPEWFDYKAYRAFVDAAEISNADLVKKTFVDLSTRGNPLVFLTGIWHGTSLVGPTAFDFLTKEEIKLYQHQERNGIREFKLKSKLTGEPFFVHALGHIDREYYAEHFEFIEENLDYSLIELQGRVRYAKSLGLVKDPLFVDLNKIQETLDKPIDDKIVTIHLTKEISLTVSLEAIDEKQAKLWLSENDYVIGTPKFKVHFLVTFIKADLMYALPHDYLLYSLLLLKFAGKFSYIPGKLSVFSNVVMLKDYFEMDYAKCSSSYRINNYGTDEVSIKTQLPTVMNNLGT